MFDAINLILFDNYLCLMFLTIYLTTICILYKEFSFCLNPRMVFLYVLKSCILVDSRYRSIINQYRVYTGINCWLGKYNLSENSTPVLFTRI